MTVTSPLLLPTTGDVVGRKISAELSLIATAMRSFWIFSILASSAVCASIRSSGLLIRMSLMMPSSSWRCAGVKLLAAGGAGCSAPGAGGWWRGCLRARGGRLTSGRGHRQARAQQHDGGREQAEAPRRGEVRERHELHWYSSPSVRAGRGPPLHVGSL